MMKKNNIIKKAVIPAAGMGTRFLPVTKSVAKEMLPIIDKPTIQYIVEECVNAGITDILIIVSPYKNAIIDHFDYFYELEEKLKASKKIKEYEEIRKIADMVNIQFVRQKEPLGLGHAILCAKTFVGNDPFAVLLGDDIVIARNKEKPAISQCIDAFVKTNHSIVGVQKVDDKDVHKYGIIDIKKELNDNLFEIKKFVEKPKLKDAPSNYAILGRYVLTPDIFNVLEKTKVDVRGEIELTNALETLNKKSPIYGCEFFGTRYDIGNKLGYLTAIVDEAINHPELSKPFKEYIKKIK